MRASPCLRSSWSSAITIDVAPLARALLALAVACASTARAEPTFEPPKLIHFVEATAPAALEARGEAVVILTIDVDDKGQPVAVAVAESAGEDFDEAAVAAARQFAYEPAKGDGKPVPARITYRYRFFRREVIVPAAPPATVPFAGTILNRGDRVPLSGITVLLDEGEPSTLTGPDGRFEFPELPPGAHTVHLRGGVSGALDLPLTLKAGKRLTVTYYVTRPSRYSSVVRGKRVVQEAVEQQLTVDEVKHIPGTQGDTLKAVQNLPGVARPPFNGGLMVVWGSAPSDTRTYVDGVYIPTLYHFSGLRSTVNSELVNSLNFMPGGFGVDYGRGLGGAIEIESRAPKTDGYHGFAQIDLIDLSTSVEGPITKNLSFAIAGRISWINLFLPAFLTSDVQASPKYWDYQARFKWKITPRDDLDVFLFGSDDDLTLVLKDPDPTSDKNIDTHTFYHRGLARYTHRFAGGATFTLTPSVGYDMPYNVHFAFGGLPFNQEYEEFEYNLRAVARVPLTPWLRLDAGLDYEGTRFQLNSTQNLFGMLRDGDNGGFGGLGGPAAELGVATDRMVLLSNHVAPFARANLSFFGKKLFVAAQLRVEIMSFVGYPDSPKQFSSLNALLEPRASVRFQPLARLGFNASVGVYHQAPDSQDLSAVFGNPRLSPEFGVHYVAGVDVQVTPTLHVEAQGFYKDLRNLVVRGASLDQLLVNGGEGRVYGGQILIRQELWKNLFGWVTYTLSRSERRDHLGDDWRLYQYDQTHLLTLLASYKLPYGFQVGLRFRYATGNPYTPVAHSFFDVNTDSYYPIYGKVYSARLPDFNQLDLRIDKTFTFDRFKFIAYLDFENVYAASSAETVIWNYNYTKNDYMSGLPPLPVIGARGEF